MADPKESRVLSTIGCLGLLVPVFMLGAAYILPHLSVDARDVSKMDEDRSRIAAGFSGTFRTPNVRVEQLRGFDVEVWVPLHDFDSVNYLDRKALIEQSGGQWCDNADSDWLFPTLTVRDAKTGKNLAVFHCLFRYSDLNPD